jgi:hypothetical protein
MTETLCLCRFSSSKESHKQIQNFAREVFDRASVTITRIAPAVLVYECVVNSNIKDSITGEYNKHKTVHDVITISPIEHDMRNLLDKPYESVHDEDFPDTLKYCDN